MTNSIFLKEAFLKKSDTLHITTEYKKDDKIWQKIENVNILIQDNNIINLNYEDNNWVFNINNYNHYYENYTSTFKIKQVLPEFTYMARQFLSGKYFWSKSVPHDFHIVKDGWVKLADKEKKYLTIRSNNWFLQFNNNVIKTVL